MASDLLQNKVKEFFFTIYGYDIKSTRHRDGVGCFLYVLTSVRP